MTIEVGMRIRNVVTQLKRRKWRRQHLRVNIHANRDMWHLGAGILLPSEFKCRLLKSISVSFVAQFTEVNFAPWQIRIYCCYVDCYLC